LELIAHSSNMNQSAVLVLCFLLGSVAGRPLQWFEDDSVEQSMGAAMNSDMSRAVEKDWTFPTTPAYMHQMSGATSFLQTSTGGHPLECDCERVKCNCVKRCECQLPSAAQNRNAAQFLELASATGKSSAPLFVDTETNECFLETGVSVGQDTHHMLDCECDKVKCNCVKHCECSLPSGAAGAGGSLQPSTDLLQVAEGKDEATLAQPQAATEPANDAQDQPQAQQQDEPQEQQAEQEKEQPQEQQKVQKKGRSRSRTKPNFQRVQKKDDEKSQSEYSYSYSNGNKDDEKSYSYEYSH